MSFEITEMWAVTHIDDDGVEGVCAINSDGVWFPLVAANLGRLDQLRPTVQRLVASGQLPRPTYIKHFTIAADIELIV